MPALIYVFHGDDGFSANEALQALVDAVRPADLRDANVTRMDVGGFTVERFGAAAMVVPFLAERRAVVVRGLLGTAEDRRTGREGRRAGNGHREAGPSAGLPELLMQLPATTDAVFVDDRLSPSNPLLAAIGELGHDGVTVREFPLLRRDALARWVRDHAANKGAQIEEQAVASLVEQVGPNLWAMDSELEKLATYCQERAITDADVRVLASGARESSVFELVDAIMGRRPEAALRVMERLLESGATGPYLLSMVARQARLVTLAQELSRTGVAQREWGARLGVTHEFVLRKTAEQSRRFRTGAVRELYRLLLETDLAIKTGETSDKLALTELVARAGTLQAASRAAR